jgi:hypothetical protein
MEIDFKDPSTVELNHNLLASFFRIQSDGQGQHSNISNSYNTSTKPSGNILEPTPTTFYVPESTMCPIEGFETYYYPCAVYPSQHGIITTTMAPIPDSSYSETSSYAGRLFMDTQLSCTPVVVHQTSASLEPMQHFPTDKVEGSEDESSFEDGKEGRILKESFSMMKDQHNDKHYAPTTYSTIMAGQHKITSQIRTEIRKKVEKSRSSKQVCSGEHSSKSSPQSSPMSSLSKSPTDESLSVLTPTPNVDLTEELPAQVQLQTDQIQSEPPSPQKDIDRKELLPSSSQQ